jgi:hypothetical protein
MIYYHFRQISIFLYVSVSVNICLYPSISVYFHLYPFREGVGTFLQSPFFRLNSENIAPLFDVTGLERCRGIDDRDSTSMPDPERNRIDIEGNRRITAGCGERGCHGQSLHLLFSAGKTDRDWHHRYWFCLQNQLHRVPIVSKKEVEKKTVDRVSPSPSMY